MSSLDRLSINDSDRSPQDRGNCAEACDLHFNHICATPALDLEHFGYDNYCLQTCCFGLVIIAFLCPKFVG